QPAPAAQYHPPTAPEFDHLARMELMKLKGLWFSGDPAQLLSFLCHVRDFSGLRSCSSSLRRVGWSGFCGILATLPRMVKKVPHHRRPDLDVQEFTIPTLVSVSAFLDGLVEVFGDKFMKENSKRALAACKQGKLTIGKYNSHFKSLVYL
ncbi:hypothetical protein VP01_8665g1, partial [Puccinia sorghi]